MRVCHCFMNNKSTIDNFMIDTLLIEPIEKIINQLNNREFRDCDCKWLDEKLGKFTKFAGETLGMKANVPSEVGQKFTVINEYTTKKYLESFTTLLEYFKSF